MKVFISTASKADAHNVDDSYERRIESKQYHMVWLTPAERRKLNGQARKQLEAANRTTKR